MFHLACSQWQLWQALCCSVGLLVLLEWQLNTAEALFLSASVGLSVDFTVNFCISYHLCPHPDRLSRVAFSLRQTSCATAVGAAACLQPVCLCCLPRCCSIASWASSS